MMEENLKKVEKISGIIGSLAESPTSKGPSKNEDPLSIESLLAKFINLKNKLTEMGKAIQHLEDRLHGIN
ncbi:MAG: hypothetical protein ACMUIA_04040 [bacterium]